MFHISALMFAVSLASAICPEPQVYDFKGSDEEKATVISQATAACKARYGDSACLYFIEQFPDGGFSVTCGPKQEAP